MERAASLARIKGVSTIWLHPVALNIHNPIRIRDGKFIKHGPVKLADMLYYTLKVITDEERTSILKASIGSEEHTVGVATLVSVLEAHGYDGLIYRNHHEDSGKDSWIILRPEQAQIIGEPISFTVSGPA
jgi:hypothetical protein